MGAGATPGDQLLLALCHGHLECFIHGRLHLVDGLLLGGELVLGVLRVLVRDQEIASLLSTLSRLRCLLGTTNISTTAAGLLQVLVQHLGSNHVSQVVQINIFLLLWLLLLIWTTALAIVLLTICRKLHRHLISLSFGQKLLMHEHVTLASSHVASIVSSHLLLLLLLLVMLGKM